ncbi:carnitine O-acetyltransferase [Enterococcus sp. DIV0840]|uniref:choline/carnitine O-acyltransferase n=1 Tax=unclassified Enterococcus TaxID=2608891 RepID=UPI001A8D62A1|nr:choline/carnitine O-acyltransferase [Enterococcus sp. DIV0849a]MBO0435691.1 choline/carnitine O-acyltransferase [Enterococcus sp. DIV0849a]
MEKYKEELLPTLKKLPVPELHETLVALSDWLRPLVTLEELKDFQKRAITFSVSDGVLLQKDLVDHAKNTAGSWLAPLWEESYLESRGHLQSESNFALIIDESYYDHIKSKEARAARLIHQMTAIYLSLADGSYPIEYTKKHQNVDMSFYLNFFKSCRIPGKDQDSFYRGEIHTAGNYIIIFVNGTYFRLEVTNELGEINSLEQVMESLNYILSLETVPKHGENLIPYLTGVERAQSALIYQQLKTEELNTDNLQQIENSLFMLSFSDGKDESKEERITEVLLNTDHQFLSKTTQAVITKNGHIGFNMEHTAIDGVPTLNLLTNIFESFNELKQGMTGKSSSDLVQKFEWVLTNEMISTLENAQKLVEIENRSYVVKHQVLSEIGKERMKKASVSPDAFFHIALAMAQQEVFGTLRSVYEPVAMRMYYEGRTESARSISQEKKLFAEAFYDETESISKEKLVELFNEAATAHSNRIMQCQKGKGLERHLFGLQKMALNPEEGLTFFSAEALKLLGEDFISTTGIPYDILESFSFCPVNKKGFGLYYGILDEKVILTLSAKKDHESEAIQMIDAVSEALISLTELLGI